MNKTHPASHGDHKILPSHGDFQGAKMKERTPSHEKPLVNLAGIEHWNSVWNRDKVKRIDLRSYYDYRLSVFFQQWIDPSSRVLEVGCGGSVWLPYFAKHMQCEVWGIDYSAPGVELCLDNLRAEGVSGNIILGDVFDSTEIPQRSFDILWSAGFIEHFNDIRRVIGRLAEYLKPGGVMITLVPNLNGFVGWLHRVVDQEVFYAHTKIEPKMLDRLHSEAGFEILSRAQFFGIFSIGVVNFNRFKAQLPGILDAVFWSSILIIQQSICLPFRLLGFHPETRWFSPWILGIYRLPQ